MKVALFFPKSLGRKLRFHYKLNWFLLFKLKCTISWIRKKSMHISLLHMQCSHKNPMYQHSVMKVALFLPKKPGRKLRSDHKSRPCGQNRGRTTFFRVWHQTILHGAEAAMPNRCRSLCRFDSGTMGWNYFLTWILVAMHQIEFIVRVSL